MTNKQQTHKRHTMASSSTRMEAIARIVQEVARAEEARIKKRTRRAAGNTLVKTIRGTVDTQALVEQGNLKMLPELHYTHPETGKRETLHFASREEMRAFRTRLAEATPLGAEAMCCSAVARCYATGTDLLEDIRRIARWMTPAWARGRCAIEDNLIKAAVKFAARPGWVVDTPWGEACFVYDEDDAARLVETMRAATARVYTECRKLNFHHRPQCRRVDVAPSSPDAPKMRAILPSVLEDALEDLFEKTREFVALRLAPPASV